VEIFCHSLRHCVAKRFVAKKCDMQRSVFPFFALNVFAYFHW